MLKFVESKDYANITIEDISKAVEEAFISNPVPVQQRQVLYTGAYGADQFDEAMEAEGGTKRIYIGFKVPRFLRVLKSPIIQSNKTGRYFKLIKIT